MRKKRHINSIDHFAYQSPMRQYNSCLKVLVAFLVLCLCILIDNLVVSLYIILTIGIFNLWKNRIQIGDYLDLLKIPLAFIILGSVAIAIEAGYGASGWYFRVPMENVKKSLSVMCKAFGAISTLYMLALSTPMAEIITVLQRFHIPKTITELMNMIYRYIFILMDVQCRIRSAAKARLGYVDFRTSCKTFSKSMASLLIISLRKAELYYDAMEARCYDGELMFLQEEKPLDIKQILFSVLYAISILLLGILTGKGKFLL